MDLKTCMDIKVKEKQKSISFKISENEFEWVAKNKLSLKKVFCEALKELGYKGE